jgi:hypothetical protein
MWRALQITWRIIWRTIEVAIVVYVLISIPDRNAGLIVGVLGLIYATIRTGFILQGLGLLQLESGLDQQVYELMRRLDQVQRRVEADTSIFDQEPQRPETATAVSRLYVDVYIALVFIALVYLICLLQVFSKL